MGKIRWRRVWDLSTRLALAAWTASHTVVRENLAPEPTISTSRLLLIQGVPEERPIYLRNFHIVCLFLVDLGESLFSFPGISAVASPEIT